MSKTTLQQLQTLDYDTLTAITDNVTNANDTFVQEKIVGPLADLTVGVLPLGYKYLGDWDATVLGDPFYSSLQNILSLADGSYDDPALNCKFIVQYIRPVASANATITTPKSNVLIKSNYRDGYSIVVGNSSISSMYFEDITLKVAQNTTFTNCKFNNVFLTRNTVSSFNITFNNCEFIDSSIKDINNVNIENSCRIKSSDIYVLNNVTFISNSRMYGCYLNVMPVDEDTYNLTKGLNVYEPAIY